MRRGAIQAYGQLATASGTNSCARSSEPRAIPVLLRLLCVVVVVVVDESASCLALLVSENSSLPLQELPTELTLAVPSPRELLAAPPSGQAFKLQSR